MVGAQARRPRARGAVRVARGAAGRPRRGGGLGALHWHFVLGCWGDGVGRGLPFGARGVLLPSLRFVVLRPSSCDAFTRRSPAQRAALQLARTFFGPPLGFVVLWGGSEMSL